jgi:hypothetical protein
MHMAMNPTLSPAGQALFNFGRTGVASVGGGLGDMLQQQRVDETDEERLRRKKGMSQVSDWLGKISGSSPALKALLGGLAGGA